MTGRDDAMVNGALVAVGTLAVVDNVVFHWLVGLHRIIENASPGLVLTLEIVAVAVGLMLAGTGLVRERRARRGPGPAAS